MGCPRRPDCPVHPGGDHGTSPAPGSRAAAGPLAAAVVRARRGGVARHPDLPGVTGIPDATTTLRFGHFLERHNLAVALLKNVSALLGARGQMVRRGTLVDATITRAPGSTKNRTGMRPPTGTSLGRGTSGYPA